uniref:Ig-like domain-containing protein n=1 Tax=Pseudonaja textilis TaxID=8673 RepID=A0A670Z2Y7_PSETE
MREGSLGQRSPTFVTWLWGRKNWAKRCVSTQVIGIIGSSIELQCSYPEAESLNYSRNRILWQIKDRFSCFVAGYFPNENMEKYQCQEFKQRTLLNEPKQGSASLQLSNIRIADEFIYQCIIQKNINGQFKLIHNESISLKVAANYSKPVITGPVQLGEEVMFMCNSSHGYPEQRLYWRSEINNSTMNITVQFTKELDGTFSVFSTLKMKVASDMKLRCTIEHKQLHQNITTTSKHPDSFIPSFLIIITFPTAIQFFSALLALQFLFYLGKVTFWIYSAQHPIYFPMSRHSNFSRRLGLER